MLYTSISVFGKMLVIIYILLDMIDKSTSDTITPEYFVKDMIKMLVGIIAIDNGWEIVTFGMQFSSAVFDKFAVPDTSASGFNERNCLYHTIVDRNWIWSLGDIFQIAFPWLILMAAKLLISTICWVRVIEIIVRAMFAPIGMADIIQEGTKGKGFGYFKKFTASVLQGAVLIGIVKSYSIINSALLVDAGTNFFMRMGIMIILAVAVVMISFKSSSIATDIVGQ